MKNDKIEYTTIDELITQLQEIKKLFPDHAICVNGYTPVFLIARPYYYDGGFAAQASAGHEFLSSRDQNSQGFTYKREGFPNGCIDIVSREPEESDEII